MMAWGVFIHCHSQLACLTAVRPGDPPKATSGGGFRWILNQVEDDVFVLLVIPSKAEESPAREISPLQSK